MDGIKLRALEPDDLDQLVRWEEDHVESGLRVAPYSRAVLKRYLEESHKDFWEAEQVRFVLSKADGMAIGLFDVFNANPIHLRAEVAMLVDPKFRGQGLGYKGLQLVERWAFSRVGLKCLHAEVFTSNISAIRVFQACGYETAGLLKAWYRVGPEFRDVQIFQRIKP